MHGQDPDLHGSVKVEVESRIRIRIENRMDRQTLTFLQLGPGYKQLKLVVTPYKKNCAEANQHYK
jgi:hypothetical protein